MNKSAKYIWGKGVNPAFQFTILATTGMVFTLPNGSSSNFTCDWGDSNVELVTTSTKTHIYSVAGTYHIKITGSMPSFSFFSNSGASASAIRSVKNIGNVGLTSFYGMFAYCNNLTTISDIDAANNVISNAYAMCYGCSSLVSFNSSMSFSNATNTQYMFGDCSSLVTLTCPLTFNSSTTGHGMFGGCTSLVSITNIGTCASMTTGCKMFDGCSKLITLPSGITFESISNAQAMFAYCYDLTGLPNTVTFNSLTYGYTMFYGCSSLASVSTGMTLPNLSNASLMFDVSTPFNGDGYSNLLIQMATVSHGSSLSFYASGAKYNDAGLVAKNFLISTYGWSFTDGGHI